MEQVKKINLSALMKNTDHQEEKTTAVEADKTTINPTSQEETSTKPKVVAEAKDNTSTKKTGVIINLDSIKSEKKEETIKEEVAEKPVKKDEKTLFYESLTSKVLDDDTDDKKAAEKTPKKAKIKVNSIKGETQDTTKQTAEKSEKKDVKSAPTQANNKKPEKGGNSNDLFLNYESDYKKKENSIIDTIHKLKEIADIKKLTKTNKVFVSSIIIATVLGISMLFYIDPETHSLENYKASILTLAGKNISHEDLQEHQEDIKNNIQWQLNQNNLGGYQLDFEILVGEAGEAIYKFEGKEYTSKVDLDVAIDKKLAVLKRKKIRDYLKNKKESDK